MTLNVFEREENLLKWYITLCMLTLLGPGFFYRGP